MENIGEELAPIGEDTTIAEEEQLSSVIEKQKKPRKKRETHSPAQLETLKRGRERLAEKRQKQQQEKKEAPVNDLLQNFETRCNAMLENFEKKMHQTKSAPKHNKEYSEIAPHSSPRVPKIQKFFV